jgi:hypothetical protein
MKRASTKRNPFVEAKGSQSRIAPARTRPAKLRMKILAGVRCLERDRARLSEDLFCIREYKKTRLHRESGKKALSFRLFIRQPAPAVN